MKSHFFTYKVVAFDISREAQILCQVGSFNFSTTWFEDCFQITYDVNDESKRPRVEAKCPRDRLRLKCLCLYWPIYSLPRIRVTCKYLLTRNANGGSGKNPFVLGLTVYGMLVSMEKRNDVKPGKLFSSVRRNTCLSQSVSQTLHDKHIPTLFLDAVISTTAQRSHPNVTSRVAKLEMIFFRLSWPHSNQDIHIQR